LRRLILRRLALLPLMLFLVSSLSFVMLSLAPGSYADTIDNPRLTPAARARMQEKFGLDDPPVQRYLHWLFALAHGDPGISFLFKAPVGTVLFRAIGPTALLMSCALALDFLLGIIIALISTAKAGKCIDSFLSLLSLTVYSLPSFWLAGLAVFFFSLRMGWFPPSHMTCLTAPPTGPGHWMDLARHLVLPAGVLGLVGAASTARYLRAQMLELRESPYLLAARARGLSPLRVLLVHGLRPALGPLVTLLGLALPALVSGSVVIEAIFAWPGMGRVLWQAAVARDVPMVMGCVLVGALAVIIGNLLADILYALVDPRART